ncbi:hypothetical protein RFM68_03950 [Mesorhizobium sp. MSK_1335]|uniref:Uncharacterized protein n=1 Tax=Mesorhizobium montanum TaxID=3072323 RepID=A0ABU4ZE59_9HYPH|nr:hypothetical protein [Mesorhizobium sp. MSK_1335]MDX8523651.1 hypothetical protein [Mesorhizobium sp. MSK_1335]
MTTTDSVIRPPKHEINAAHYDNDCQDALAARLNELIEMAERAGWNRNRVASALMYLAAKRLNSGSR